MTCFESILLPLVPVQSAALTWSLSLCRLMCSSSACIFISFTLRSSLRLVCCRLLLSLEGPKAARRSGHLFLKPYTPFPPSLPACVCVCHGDAPSQGVREGNIRSPASFPSCSPLLQLQPLFQLLDAAVEFGDHRVLAHPLRALQMRHSALQVLVLMAPEEQTKKKIAENQKEKEEGEVPGSVSSHW